MLVCTDIDITGAVFPKVMTAF